MIAPRYGKTTNVFARDPETKYKYIMEGVYSNPEIEYLSPLEFWAEEKLDGTNIRVAWYPTYREPMDKPATRPRIYGEGGKGCFEIRGRSDNANLHGTLVENMKKVFTPELATQLLNDNVQEMTMYGEGVGRGVQSGGDYGELKFVMFDVVYPNSDGKFTYRDRSYVYGLGSQYGIKTAPFVGLFTLEEGMAAVKKGVKSILKYEHQRTLDGWNPNIPPPIAEGLIFRPMFPLFNRYGERFVLKGKTKDFPPTKE